MSYYVYSIVALPLHDGPHYSSMSMANISAWVSADSIVEARQKIEARLKSSGWSISRIEHELEGDLSRHPYHHRDTQPQDPMLQAGLLYSYEQLLNHGIGVEIFGLLRGNTNELFDPLSEADRGDLERD